MDFSGKCIPIDRREAHIASVFSCDSSPNSQFFYFEVIDFNISLA